MTKPINDFSDAKVGDKVTCYENGYGEITSVGVCTYYPIAVDFGNGEKDTYQADGWMYDDRSVAFLFKGHVEFPDPIPVKIKVKKTLWANIYKNEFGSYEVGQRVLHPKKETADKSKMRNSLALAEVTFEVEE